MGADWIRKTEEKYKHCLQKSRRHLSLPPLLRLDKDKITVRYPCHWLSEERTLPKDTALTIFQRGPRSRIAVLLENQAVGEIRGEAAADISKLFRSDPKLCNVLQVVVVETSAPSAPFHVQVTDSPDRKTSPSDN